MGKSEINRPRFARRLRRFAGFLERRGGEELRRELLAGIRGRVLEVGPGDGVGFSYYPLSVSEVVAVEPEPSLRKLARLAAAAAPVPVEVVPGSVEELPFAAGEFDAVVVATVLCSVRDQERALAEIRRVLRPGGELRFWEHVAAPGGFLRLQQKAVDLVWPFFAGGCHAGRDSKAQIERAGFAIERCREFKFQPTLFMHAFSPQVLGIARSPE